MAHQYWYGLEWEFQCPKCKRENREKAVINSTTNDIEKIKASIQKERLACSRCGVPLEDYVGVEVIHGTPEQLTALGFVFPTEQEIQGRNSTDSGIRS